MAGLVSILLAILFYYVIPITALSQPAVTNSPLDVDCIRSMNIKCVLTDIDGTLLRKNHTISDRSFRAIRKIMQKGIKFFPATGRSRISMKSVVGNEFIKVFGSTIDEVPGVFGQGLQVYGVNGKLIYERF